MNDINLPFHCGSPVKSSGDTIPVAVLYRRLTPRHRQLYGARHAIQNNRVVSLAYTLKDDKNEIVNESSDGSFCYLHGASNIIPGLEDSLTSKRAGDVLCVSVAPEHGYGVRDDERIQEVPRDMFRTTRYRSWHAVCAGAGWKNIVVMVTRVDATVSSMAITRWQACSSTSMSGVVRARPPPRNWAGPAWPARPPPPRLIPPITS
jgi:FKBP-type peptidyl-prolyl cis-trans isomerase SlyD